MFLSSGADIDSNSIIGMMERRSIRIAVVGDSKCGKTSLITTLVSSTFPEQPPPVLQQVHIPPEETSDNVALCITDTSSAPKDRDQMLHEVSQAHVVILVYSVEDDSSKLFGHNGQLDLWIQDIALVFKGPILVVGNKVDLASKEIQDRTAYLREKMKYLLDKYGKQVDLTWECSSKLNMNVSEIFHMAQHSVLYPLAPLFDTKTKELRPKFKKALCRVFRIFDADRDGLLSDTELNTFQERCFGVRLTPTDIEQVKTVLQRQGTGLVLSQGISLEGFQFINKTFINRNRAETSWLVLRMFGYDDDLEIQVPPSLYVLKDKERDQSVELSPRALHFFEAIFNQFDRDKDGALSPTEMDELFSICPGGNHPWSTVASFRTGNDKANKGSRTRVSSDGSNQEQVLSNLCDFPNSLKTNENGYVNLSGWLAQWTMTTLLQPQTTLLHLQYLGYGFGPKSAVKLTRSRRIEDEENDLRRNVVRGFVFGGNSVNKSGFLDALVNKNPAKKSSWQMYSQHPDGASETATVPSSYSLDSPHVVGVRSVASIVKARNIQGTNKNRGSYLVLTEIPVDEFVLEEVFESRMVDCDLAIMLFNTDDISSVDYLRNIQERIPETVPCVYLYESRKSSARSAETDLEDEAAFDTCDALTAATKLCRENSLPDPEPVVLDIFSNQYSRGKVDHLFELLMTTAFRPDAARPISSQRRMARRRRRLMRATLRISLVAVAAVSTTWVLYSLLSSLGGDSKKEVENKTSSNSMRTEKEYMNSSHTASGVHSLSVPQIRRK